MDLLFVFLLLLLLHLIHWRPNPAPTTIDNCTQLRALIYYAPASQPASQSTQLSAISPASGAPKRPTKAARTTAERSKYWRLKFSTLSQVCRRPPNHLLLLLLLLAGWLDRWIAGSLPKVGQIAATAGFRIRSAPAKLPVVCNLSTQAEFLIILLQRQQRINRAHLHTCMAAAGQAAPLQRRQNPLADSRQGKNKYLFKFDINFGKF